MVSERNRINKIVDYLESNGVQVNISKNKAQGNKGFFRIDKKSQYRIDISKELSEKEVLRTLVHEYIHYVHYKYDTDFSSLEFIFPEYNDNDLIEKELTDITVDYIPKDFASSLFNQKEYYQKEINSLLDKLKSYNFDILRKRSYPYPIPYFIKYDKISYNNKVYLLDNIYRDFEFLSKEDVMYINLKSCQYKLKRINSKISRLNRYYNKKSELLARFCEIFFLQKEKAYKIAPLSSRIFIKNIEKLKIDELRILNKILTT